MEMIRGVRIDETFYSEETKHENEFAPDDILAPDRAACEIFKGGWAEKIQETIKNINPEIRFRV